jgi:hypothetical protein
MLLFQVRGRMDDGTTWWGILGVVGDQWLAGQTSDEH